MNILKLIFLKSLAPLTRYTRACVIACLFFAATPSLAADPVPATGHHAVAILIDNSVSMKAAGAEQHVSGMIDAYLRSMPDDTHFMLIAYDDLASVLAPWSSATTDDHATLLEATKRLEFSARRSNVGAGLERALFELGVGADNPSARAVLLVHAGAIDTGDAEQDQSFKRWAGVVLANDAKEQKIPIYVLTLGDGADQGLSKRLAANTYGVHRHAVSVDDGHTKLDVLKRRFLIQIEHADEASSGIGLADINEPVETLGPGDNRLEQPTLGTLESIAEINERIAEFPPGAGISKTSAAGGAASERFILPGLATKAGQEETGNAVPIEEVLQPEDATQPAWTDKQAGRIAVVAILASGIAGVIVFLLRRRAGRDTEDTPAPSSHEAYVVLKDVHGVTAQGRYVITERLVRICRDAGRNSLNVVCVTIPDDVISREHAFIECRDNEYWVTDSGSNNGTFVNDKRIEGIRKLKHGDRLRFATYEFLFEQAAVQTAGPRASAPPDATLAAAGAAVATPEDDEATILGGVQSVETEGSHLFADGSGSSETWVNTAGRDESQSDRTQVRIPREKG